MPSKRPESADGLARSINGRHRSSTDALPDVSLLPGGVTVATPFLPAVGRLDGRGDCEGPPQATKEANPWQAVEQRARLRASLRMSPLGPQPLGVPPAARQRPNSPPSPPLQQQRGTTPQRTPPTPPTQQILGPQPPQRHAGVSALPRPPPVSARPPAGPPPQHASFPGSRPQPAHDTTTSPVAMPSHPPAIHTRMQYQQHYSLHLHLQPLPQHPQLQHHPQYNLSFMNGPLLRPPPAQPHMAAEGHHMPPGIVYSLQMRLTSVVLVTAHPMMR